MRRRAIACAACLLGLAAQAPPLPDDEDIVVHGERPYIVVHGLPHCRPRHDDPYDAVAVPEDGRQRVVAPNRHSGTLETRRDDNPVSGPAQWHRAGTDISAFVYRAPTDGGPLCIGARRETGGFGQLRQILDAQPYHGHRIRVTAYVLTSEAGEVRFWLSTGDSHMIMLGQDSSDQPLRGTHRWTPVSMTIGPVPILATKLSYGFLLMRHGDVWVNRLHFEVLDPRPGERLPGSEPAAD
jgi:hypothetical protein